MVMAGPQHHTMSRGRASVIFAHWCSGVAGSLAWTFLFMAAASAQEQKPRQAASGAHGSSQAIAEGRQAFESHCAGCHGLDGRGGERAPDVATRASARRRSDAELFQIIQSGIP